MGVIKVKPGSIRNVLRQANGVTKEVVREAARLAAQRAVAELKRISPTDQGMFRAAWRVGGADQMRVVNDAPYAAIIERGARPHQVSFEGRVAITQWARRKFGDTKEIHALVQGIINKIAAQGQKPHWLVRNNIDRFRAWAVEEFNRRIQRRIESGAA